MFWDAWKGKSLEFDAGGCVQDEGGVGPGLHIVGLFQRQINPWQTGECVLQGAAGGLQNEIGPRHFAKSINVSEAADSQNDLRIVCYTVETHEGRQRE